MLIKSLSNSFEAYKKHPFIFIWGSLVYILMLVVFFMAAVGFFLIYFMVSSLVGVPVDIYEIPTMVVLGLVGLAFLYFLSGLSAGLSMTYQKALTQAKTSLADFYAYSLSKAPVMFEILIIRDVLTLLVIGPAIAIYIYFLAEFEFTDVIIGAYSLFWIFVIHCIFTPALMAGGAFRKGLFASMRRAFVLLRKKHINYLGLFILFAFAWVLNFIPFLQLVSLFFIYPVVYAAIISMMEKVSPSEG